MRALLCGALCAVGALELRAEQGERVATAAWPSAAKGFTAPQQECIATYKQKVGSIFPKMAERLNHRKWGGKAGTPSPSAPPVLCAGFGTTGTRSLEALFDEVGWNNHHWSPRDPPAGFWPAVLYDVMGATVDCGPMGEAACAKESWTDAGRDACIDSLNGIDFGRAYTVGSQFLSDTPIADQFLDFYVRSPESKVILTSRPGEGWYESRVAKQPNSNAPVESACGIRMTDLTVQQNSNLLAFHDDMVRCMVPAHKLLEINLFRDGSAGLSQRIATFVGDARFASRPFPHATDGADRLLIARGIAAEQSHGHGFGRTLAKRNSTVAKASTVSAVGNSTVAKASASTVELKGDRPSSVRSAHSTGR